MAWKLYIPFVCQWTTGARSVRLILQYHPGLPRHGCHGLRKKTNSRRTACGPLILMCQILEAVLRSNFHRTCPFFLLRSQKQTSCRPRHKTDPRPCRLAGLQLCQRMNCYDSADGHPTYCTWHSTESDRFVLTNLQLLRGTVSDKSLPRSSWMCGMPVANSPTSRSRTWRLCSMRIDRFHPAVSQSSGGMGGLTESRLSGSTERWPSFAPPLLVSAHST